MFKCPFLAKSQIDTTIVAFFLKKLVLWFMKYKSQETIAMLPTSNENPEISLQNGLDL